MRDKYPLFFQHCQQRRWTLILVYDTSSHVVLVYDMLSHVILVYDTSSCDFGSDILDLCWFKLLSSFNSFKDMEIWIHTWYNKANFASYWLLLIPLNDGCQYKCFTLFVPVLLYLTLNLDYQIYQVG